MAQVGEIATIVGLVFHFFIIQIKLKTSRRSCKFTFCIIEGAFGLIIKKMKKKPFTIYRLFGIHQFMRKAIDVMSIVPDIRRGFKTL